MTLLFVNDVTCNASTNSLDTSKSPPLCTAIRFVTCLPRCGGEGSELYGGAGGGRDPRSVEFGCHRGIHNGVVRMTGSPWGL